MCSRNRPTGTNKGLIIGEAGVTSLLGAATALGVSFKLVFETSAYLSIPSHVQMHYPSTSVRDKSLKFREGHLVYHST